ncbi:MAG TPA: hypothetical protein VM165_17025 [Planctomycetaceae bacterium]|nr:hypothetical protein [Planctomycetaceae bacterium]
MNAGLQPTTAASHTIAVTAVTPCRHRRRHRSRRTSRSVCADRHRGGKPAAIRSCVQVPQNRATVPEATPTSRQNRSSVTFGPVRAASSRNSVRKSWAAAFMRNPRRVVDDQKPRAADVFVSFTLWGNVARILRRRAGPA